MTNDHGLFYKFKESSLSISLTAALILVASIVVIISSITIQSAYMWLAVGATAVLFLGFCSCTTCEKTSHFQFRRGSVHSDSISTISDGRDNFYEVNHPTTTPPYWIADLPPSYAAATAPSALPENQQPPPYSAVVDVHNTTGNQDSEVNKPCDQSNSDYIGEQSSDTTIVIEETSVSPPSERNCPTTIAGVHIGSNNRTVRNITNDTRHSNNYQNDTYPNGASLC